MRIILRVLILLAVNKSQNCFGQAAVTPVLYNVAGSQYTQNFDGLPSAGTYLLTGKGPFNLNSAPFNVASMGGWQFMMISGSNANAAFAVGTGSSTGNGVYSLGSAASGERALGSLSSSTGIYSMGMVLTNNTGAVLNSFSVSLTAEQWRKGGSSNKNNWSFHYKTGLITNIDQAEMADDPNLNFSSVINTSSATSLNGNLPENQQPVSYTVHAINWKPGEQLLLRWDDADETGNDDAVGIDNFIFSASLTSAAPTVNNQSVTNISTNSALVSGSVNDNYAVTSIVCEYDTLNTFSTSSQIHTVPDTLQPGSGNTNVTATIAGLVSGKTYYFRIKAHNINGTVTGNIQSFTTAVSLPTVTTRAASSITTNTALLGGNIITQGGAVITEKGIVWSSAINPTLLNNKIIMESGDGNFLQLVNSLPQGSVLYARAYAINSGGVAYGDTIRFITQTLITSFNPVSTAKNNSALIFFNLKTAQNISGLSGANFSLQTSGISGVVITSVTGSANSFTVTVNTGTGDGTLGIIFTNDSGLSLPVNNKPFIASDVYTIDKTPPQINAVSIPDRTIKAGDTVAVSITVKPDTDVYRMVSGNIDGFILSAFSKKNDSSYSCFFVAANGGNDVDAIADIPLSILLIDSAGNSSLYQTPIRQSSDLIDVNKPFITLVHNPAKGIYKTGDTLNFVFRFSEKIIIGGGVPSVTLTVGTRSRSAVYVSGSGSDSLLFRYMIVSGDLDTDGIKTAGTVTLNNAQVKDPAGNIASVSFSNVLPAKEILVDAVAPTVTSVIVPESAVYRTGNILDLVANFSKKVFVPASENSSAIAISIGSKIKNAVYISGSGSNALLFRYTVQVDDVDTDGIKLISPINDINSSITDSVGNHAVLTLNNIGSMNGIRINPPTIAVTNMILPDTGIYKTGDSLEFLINYNEPVTVSVVNGTPSLKLTVGLVSKQAVYINGSGSNTLLFRCIVQTGDEDMDGIKLSSSILLNNGSIKDAQGNNAPLILNITGNTQGILVDAVAPMINNVIVPAGNTYKANDTISCLLVFSEPVTVNIKTDTPVLKLTIGSAQKNMLYAGGSATTGLSFRYIIQPGDLAKSGISIASAITLNSASINDAAGNAAIVGFKVPTLSAIKIDGIAPVFVSTQTEKISLCENNPAVTVSNIFAVADEEQGELISWKIKKSGSHGALSTLSATTTSNGKNITPSGITYKPYNDQYGTDTIITEVTDGIYTSQKMIVFVVQPSLQNNIIGTSQVLCVDQTPLPFSGSMPIGGDGSYSFIWEISGSDSLHFGNAAGVMNLQQYIPQPVSISSWFRRRVISGACSDTSAAIKITVVKNGVWQGKNSNDWHNANNWCGNFLPNNTTDVFVYANTLYDPLIRDSAWCNHLTLADNTHLTITGILQVNGNIAAASDAVVAEKGTIVFNGTKPQNISGKIFTARSLQNMVINNRAGVSLTDSLLLTGTLVLNAGSFNTNNHFLLKHGASIGASATGTSITGNISAEHFIKGGRRCFWLLGHPFNRSIGLEMMKDSIDITGDDGSQNGFTSTATNQPSAFRYDPFAGNDSTGFDTGWLPFTHTNGLGNNAWKPYDGIRLFVRGRPGQGLDGTPAGDGKNGTYLPLPLTIKLSGGINTGDQEISLPTGSHPGYHVVSNPYLSNIDMSRITKGNEVALTYWLWDPQQGKYGGYTCYLFRDKNILSMFGAFIAKANGNGNNKLLFTENCKSTEASADTVPVVGLDDTYCIELRLETDSIFRDRILIQQMDSAKSSIDKNDGEKLLNSDVNFYSISREQKMLSIDARPIDNTSTIPLGIQTSEAGSFRIRVAKNSLPSSQLLLHDIYLNRWMALEKDSSYIFTVTADTASSGNNRFEITALKKITDIVVEQPSIDVKVNPVPASDKVMVQYIAAEAGNTSIRILNLYGKPVKILTLGLQKQGQATVSINDLLPGIYLLELRCGNQVSTRKIIKE